MKLRSWVFQTFLFGWLIASGPIAFAPAATVLIEAEGFYNAGGWVIDTQSMEQMGSPYLLAHGLGMPVKDASTTVDLPEPGKYHVLVRTRDWVANWKVSGIFRRPRVSGRIR
jgi:hypothetical protein